mmetsp:Transcript_12430/g.22537  ORF Transcript_12430/g.22537 Transcript_12430/m.22537 type:complete len:245 (+) Transcript_12430:1243-1977(+)
MRSAFSLQLLVSRPRVMHFSLKSLRVSACKSFLFSSLPTASACRSLQPSPAFNVRTSWSLSILACTLYPLELHKLISCSSSRSSKFNSCPLDALKVRPCAESTDLDLNSDDLRGTGGVAWFSSLMALFRPLIHAMVSDIEDARKNMVRSFVSTENSYARPALIFLLVLASIYENPSAASLTGMSDKSLTSRIDPMAIRPFSSDSCDLCQSSARLQSWVDSFMTFWTNIHRLCHGYGVCGLRFSR